MTETPAARAKAVLTNLFECWPISDPPWGADAVIGTLTAAGLRVVSAVDIPEFVLDLSERLKAAERERDGWMNRCAAAVCLVPGERLVGELQDAKAAIDKRTEAAATRVKELEYAMKRIQVAVNDTDDFTKLERYCRNVADAALARQQSRTGDDNG